MVLDPQRWLELRRFRALVEDGPRPKVWTWPLTDPPALWVRQQGTWRWASVMARQDWPDGRIAH
ncbi:hypothetical protein ACIO93_42570 [Streptomyces sp. NPDC087903]|uniref:hypothetical protein n=1 Tax=Streptomyces sp. NPDC087903 TaxID=3365819 RepID=UPI0038180868